MSNIIDSIKVSGVTYEIQGGSITVDPTLDSGSTNPVANSAITTALDAKVNVADNEVSGVTVVTVIGFGEEFAYGKVNKITVKSTVSGGSGTRTVNFYCVSSNGLPSLCTLKYQYSNRTITSITSTSGNFTATLNNGAIDITFSSGYSFNFLYTSDSRFAVYGYMVYDGGQSADVLEGSVGQAITDVAAKIPPTMLTDANLSISNSNGNITLRITDQAGSNITINRPLYDRKTLKYDNTNGLYVNFYGETAHTVTLNTSNGNYCMIPDVTSSYKDGLDSITVRVNSGYTGSTSSFSWKLNGVDNSGTTYENTYTYDKTNNTVTLSGSSTFNVSVTNDGYYFTFTPTDTNTRIWRLYETSCNIAGIENIYQERYIIDLVQALTYQYNGQEVIDDIYSKLDTKQTTLTAGTGIDITNNVISATGGGGGGVSESAFTAYTAATDSRIAEDEEVTAAALNALDEKIDNIDGTATVELTQAEYDALVTAGTVSADTYYIITDAQAGDLTNYYTKTETNTLLGGKADTATTYTKTEVDNAITGATSTKQDTLVSGTNIKTINNESLLGSGNIDIQGGGGGKAIEAGRGISVTTGETADTVSFDLPISAATNGSILIGVSCSANRDKSFVGGQESVGQGEGSFAFGEYCKAGQWSIAVGSRVEANIMPSTAAFGKYNKQNGGYFEPESATTLFSVGNGTSTSARHNAFEVRQNGDIYLSSGGTDIKLQDHLGGGGVDVVQTTGTSTTDVMSQNAVTTQLGRFVTVAGDQTISGRKIFTYSDNSGKAIEFKQTSDSAKVGFSIKNSAATNNELASFELRPNTFTIDGVQHPLLYFGHYRNKNTANAGVPQTVIGYRQYDQKNAAAYHYLMPLPEKAKTPFSLTTSFKDYYAPMGFKNGSTMITADNTGVVDLSSELDGLKLKKLTQAQYDALSPNYDSNTLYVIVN